MEAPSFAHEQWSIVFGIPYRMLREKCVIRFLQPARTRLLRHRSIERFFEFAGSNCNVYLRTKLFHWVNRVSFRCRSITSGKRFLRMSSAEVLTLTYVGLTFFILNLT